MLEESPFAPTDESEPAAPKPKSGPDFPPTHDDTDPGVTFGITWEDVYKEWLQWDLEGIKTNIEGIAIFEHLARKHLDDKKFYDECQEIIHNLKLHNEELKKDAAYVRTKLPQGNKASGDGIRFRLEEDKRKDGNA